MAGRYSGGVPSLEVFLKGHAGDLLRVDRKARPAEHVTAPALTLGLALQPDVLRDIARLPGFRGRGLLARILYSLPENTVGRRRVGAAAVPASVSHAYHHQLRAAVLTLAGDTDPITLRLSTEANERVLDLERRIEPRLAPDADLGHITDWASKLVGATTRMTGLLHLAGTLRTDWTGPIPANHVDAAARLGHYFLAHALAVFDTMSADPTIDDARAVLHWIGRTNQTAFSRRDAFSALSRSRFRKVADLDPALTLLDDHGFLRPRPTSSTHRRGTCVPDLGGSSAGRRSRRSRSAMNSCGFCGFRGIKLCRVAPQRTSGSPVRFLPRPLTPKHRPANRHRDRSGADGPRAREPETVRTWPSSRSTPAPSTTPNPTATRYRRAHPARQPGHRPGLRHHPRVVQPL